MNVVDSNVYPAFIHRLDISSSKRRMCAKTFAEMRVLAAKEDARLKALAAQEAADQVSAGVIPSEDFAQPTTSALIGGLPAQPKKRKQSSKDLSTRGAQKGNSEALLGSSYSGAATKISYRYIMWGYSQKNQLCGVSARSHNESLNQLKCLIFVKSYYTKLTCFDH